MAFSPFYAAFSSSRSLSNDDRHSEVSGISFWDFLPLQSDLLGPRSLHLHLWIGSASVMRRWFSCQLWFNISLSFLSQLFSISICTECWSGPTSFLSLDMWKCRIDDEVDVGLPAGAQMVFLESNEPKTSDHVVLVATESIHWTKATTRRVCPTRLINKCICIFQTNILSLKASHWRWWIHWYSIYSLYSPRIQKAGARLCSRLAQDFLGGRRYGIKLLSKQNHRLYVLLSPRQRDIFVLCCESEWRL